MNGVKLLGNGFTTKKVCLKTKIQFRKENVITELLRGGNNIGTNAVKLAYSDGSVLTIDRENVENFYDVTSS